MFNKFYVKYFLFCLLLFLCALIIESKRNVIIFPVFFKEDINFIEKKEETTEKEYLIFVSDLNDVIFPLNIVVKKDDNYKISYYNNKILNSNDDIIYMTFSLLTNYSNYLPKGVKTIIPQSTVLLDYEIKEGELTLNLSREFLNYNKDFEDKMLSIITYSFTNILNINKVVIKCENNVVVFDKQTKSVFSREDFALNVFFNTSNLNDSLGYIIYYYTYINDNYYLVKATIFEEKGYTNDETSVFKLMTKNFNIPLITFIDEDSIDSIKKSEDKNENLRYYQYYFTCFENNIIVEDTSIDIKNINYYNIELK